MQEQVAVALVGALSLVTLGLAVALWRARARTRDELEQARLEAAELRRQVAEIERRLDGPPAPAATPAPPDPAATGLPDYVITRLGEGAGDGDAATAVPERIGGPLFADLVLRETVVKAGGLAHGLRRALSPEVRNRIRFEVRREVKRSRKQRRSDLREARRDWEARQRAAVDLDDGDAA